MYIMLLHTCTIMTATVSYRKEGDKDLLPTILTAVKMIKLQKIYHQGLLPLSSTNSSVLHEIDIQGVVTYTSPVEVFVTGIKNLDR